MATKVSKSSIGPLGAFVIALAIVIGLIQSSIKIAAIGIGAGIVILLVAAITDRLDTIIDLLRRKQPDDPKEKGQ